MPKVRAPRQAQEKEIETYANRSQDAMKEKRKKQSRICISLFEDELEKLKKLAEEDGRSISSFVRVQLLKSMRELKESL